MIKSAFTLAMIVFFFFAFEAIAGSDTYNVDADATSLYKKHCSACHPNAARLRSAKNIMRSMTHAPRGMPVFDEDRISKKDAEKLVDYIRYDERYWSEK
jgi:hypothetical protein